MAIHNVCMDLYTCHRKTKAFVKLILAYLSAHAAKGPEVRDKFILGWMCECGSNMEGKGEPEARLINLAPQRRLDLFQQHALRVIHTRDEPSYIHDSRSLRKSMLSVLCKLFSELHEWRFDKRYYLHANPPSTQGAARPKSFAATVRKVTLLNRISGIRQEANTNKDSRQNSLTDKSTKGTPPISPRSAGRAPPPTPVRVGDAVYPSPMQQMAPPDLTAISTEEKQEPEVASHVPTPPPLPAGLSVSVSDADGNQSHVVVKPLELPLQRSSTDSKRPTVRPGAFRQVSAKGAALTAATTNQDAAATAQQPQSTVHLPKI
eukprot:TRINITY_DN78226_c0_g1_i1.p1 TRINITY_DN78226_c0_g1~~TRINITY_DN78226_c0_g1_i1.p1  ORF type:complete len:345 (-),score=32.24 TRINITY_DN78226_c0_g1_i1:48-1004(-)